jgi:tetratricopeptide (TPR) repeat protein
MTTFRALLIQTVALGAASVLLPAALVSRAQAQAVEWRHDYVAARKEAVEKGRPMMLDFGTENCFWCRQLDNRTFTDPTIIRLLNQQFIALKVDANRNPNLTEALRIQNYPTMVFASPDGRVLGSQEGFVEAPVLKDLLDRVLANADPEWMLRNYQEACKAREAGDFDKALTLVKPILEDGKSRPVQTRAAQLLRELEQLAATKALAVSPPPLVKPVGPPAVNPVDPSAVKTTEPVPTLEQDSSQGSRAVVALNEVARVIKAALASRQGAQMLITLASRNESAEQMRVRQAQDLLTQAREDYRKQNYLACLDRCEMLIHTYGDLSESLEANTMALEIQKNPDWIKLACDQLNERLCVMYLNLAESWLKKGQPQQAIFYLQRVLVTAPNSRHAEMAQVRLAQLQGQPLPRMQEQKK